MYAVIEYNQASGLPELHTTEVFDSLREARLLADDAAAATAEIGRREWYEVVEMYVVHTQDYQRREPVVTHDDLKAEVERLRRQVERHNLAAMAADDYACGPNCCVYDLAANVLAASHTEADDA